MARRGGGNLKQLRSEAAKRLGFTLAEVLITLGVIGVVAAITLPSLIEQHQKQSAIIRAKQTFVLLNNALERAKADYGMDISNWHWIEGADNKEKSMYFAENYILPYLNTVAYSADKPMDKVINLKNYTIEYATKHSDTGVSFVLNNGVLVYLKVGTNNGGEIESGDDINRVIMIYDIDGTKGYNKYGKDVFKIELGGYNGWFSQSMISRNRFLPYLYNSSRKCEDYLESSFVGAHACSDGSDKTKFACLAYIMCNGWQIDDKYPW